MINKLYIDDKDAYTFFGMFATVGSYAALAEYPALKSVKYNDWHEENGIEPDLSEPVLDGKEFTMNFAYIDDTGDKFNDFIELMQDTAYHTFYFKDLERTYKLRLVSQNSMRILRDLKQATLTLADDFPLPDYTYLAPSSTVTAANDYLIDDKKFTDYGVNILAGTLAEIEKRPAVKSNLSRNIGTQNGIIYDDSAVTFQSKDVTLNCLMRAASVTELWRNRDALLYDLVRPGARKLFVAATEKDYSCFYKSCNVSRFFATGKIWMEFTISLTFING